MAQYNVLIIFGLVFITIGSIIRKRSMTKQQDIATPTNRFRGVISIIVGAIALIIGLSAINSNGPLAFDFSLLFIVGPVALILILGFSSSSRFSNWALKYMVGNMKTVDNKQSTEKETVEKLCKRKGNSYSRKTKRMRCYTSKKILCLSTGSELLWEVTQGR